MPDNVIRLPVIEPLWYQLLGWKAFDLGKRRQINSLHRRGGKDFRDLSVCSREAVRHRGTYYYVFPTRRWGERAVWETMARIGNQSKPIIDWIFPDSICKKFVSDLRVEIMCAEGGTSKFFMGGSDNLDFVGQGGQGYGLSEFSLHKREVTSLLAPIIRQSQAFLLLNGTMRGKKNPLYEILQNVKDDDEWFSTWQTPEYTKLYYWINEAEGISINPELAKYDGAVDPVTGKLYINAQGTPYYNIQRDIDSGLVSLHMARQEYMNRADSEVSGSYYGAEIRALESRGDIRAIDPFSDIVYTFWDLGGRNEENDKTAIVFAHINPDSGVARVIDYYEAAGGERKQHWDVVLSKRYNYGGHYYPHDGKRVTNVWAGESHATTAIAKLGLELRFIPKTQNTMNDIEITRRGFAKTSFSNSSNVDDLLQHLVHYHESETTGKPCHKNNCRECGGASHGADAFRYMQMAIHLKLVKPYMIKNHNGNYVPNRQQFADDYSMDSILI